jgi:hypothetical protein
MISAKQLRRNLNLNLNGHWPLSVFSVLPKLGTLVDYVYIIFTNLIKKVKSITARGIGITVTQIILIIYIRHHARVLPGAQ